MRAQSIAHAAGVYVALGGMPILRDVRLDVRAGESCALIGSNGSGKTTFLRALLGLAPHQEGTIEWFGQPLASFKDWSKIGYVPQRSLVHTSNATVREVVACGLLPTRKPFMPIGRAGRAAIDAALEQVNLDERGSWPMAKLSGGQQQRVLVARALVARPEVLVLDEPMVGIDVATQESLTDIFASLKASGLAMLAVLHEQGPMGRLIDTTVELHDGRIVSDSPDR